MPKLLGFQCKEEEEEWHKIKGWRWQLLRREVTSVAEMSSLNNNPIQTKYKVEVRKCRICRKAAENEENTMFEVEKLLSEVYI